MSGVRRFLSRREKSPQRHHHHRRSLSQRGLDRAKLNGRPAHFGGVFTLPPESQKKFDKDTEKKVKGVIERLRYYGIENVVESNVEYALQVSSPQGDPHAAFQLLMLLEDTYEGLLKPYDSDVKLLGAVNRQNVTCYLDALLFAMFARLDSFEAMVYSNFEDVKRKRLAGLLRLWINMLRSGRLITTDITEHIQNALAELGWSEASKIQQQDPSEAFTFITGQLELPMLTLKMDMYHTGREEPQDDHKFVNERLLEVALLDAPAEGASVVTLEDCLEHYFNNRIEVKRHLDRQRRNTLKSANTAQSGTKMEKESGTHVEVLDLGDSPLTPMSQPPSAQTSVVELAATSKNPMDKLRPASGRKRTDSIFSQRKTELVGIDPEALNSDGANALQDATGRKLSMRTEVLMPAWQFFKLLPWYADNMPTTDAQVAAHFAKKRPVLGICLKRYSYTNTGQARKLDTYVDIPLEIAVPNFVGDDNMHENGPLVGNFRLVLQSVVCHRGVSVNSGHYICLCRGRQPSAQRPSNADGRRDGDDGDDANDPWMRFDDLAKERISFVDVHEALKKEMPYLLFYQVLPIGEDDNSMCNLPSYAEATSRSGSDAAPAEKPYLHEPSGSDYALDRAASEPNTSWKRPSSDFSLSSARNSFDAARVLNSSRGRDRLSTDSPPKRHSIAIDEPAHMIRAAAPPTTADGSSRPPTPSDDRGSSLLSVASRISGSRRGSRVSTTSAPRKSNSPSPSSDRCSPNNGPAASRFGLNVGKLTQRTSRVDPDGGGARPSLDEDESAHATAGSSVANGSAASSIPKAATAAPHKLRKDKEKRKAGLRPDSGGGKHDERECELM